MRIHPVLATVLVLAGTMLCARLGFWQLSRWEEKKALRAAREALRHAPPVEMAGEPAPLEAVAGRLVRASGRYDESRHVLLRGQARDETQGVEIITPLLLADGSAVLVNRGWLYAADGVTARPQEHAEPGEVRVLGIAEPLRSGAAGPPLRAIEADTVALYSARWLDHDSLAARFPYAIAPYVVREAPGPGVPARPARAWPREVGEGTHLGYAIQWFVFGGILLLGSAALAWTRRRRADR